MTGGPGLARSDNPAGGHSRNWSFWHAIRGGAQKRTIRSGSDRLDYGGNGAGCLPQIERGARAAADEFEERRQHERTAAGDGSTITLSMKLGRRRSGTGGPSENERAPLQTGGRNYPSSSSPSSGLFSLFRRVRTLIPSSSAAR